MSGPLLNNVKDVELWANTKLSGDWSAPGVVSQIDQSKLQMLGTVFSTGKLDQLVKVRLLIACLLLPKAKKADLAPELEQLARAACNDDDEWVRVMGCSAGDFSGQLNLDAVMQENPMVDETVKSIWSQLAEAHSPSGFLPLQELYLHPDIRTVHHQATTSQAQLQEDFRPRDPPEGVAGLPDFSIEALHGELLPGGQLLASGARGGNASVHARRGTGLSGTGMFISSKSLGLPQRVQTPRAASLTTNAAPSLFSAASGEGVPQPLPDDAAAAAAAPAQRPPPHLQSAASLQRPAKRIAVAVTTEEGSELPRSGSGGWATATTPNAEAASLATPGSLAPATGPAGSGQESAAAMMDTGHEEF